MAIHNSPHPLAGRTVTIDSGSLEGYEYTIEDWFDRINGKSWKDSNGNFSALDYAVRANRDRLSIDDEVVYGKIGGAGTIIHVSQLPICHRCEATGLVLGDQCPTCEGSGLFQ